MLFQKEKEDKNQINRLDQKKRKALSKSFFPAFPDKPENAFWKSIPVHLSEKSKSHSGDCDGFAAVFFRSAHAAFFYGYL